MRACSSRRHSSQPRREAQCREAVVLVVALDLGPKGVRNTGRVARLELHLDLDERPRCRGQVHRPSEVVERLQPLDRVALDRGAQPLPDYAVEVDEHAAAQQPVDFVLAGCVAAHQALDCGGLVGAVVVDVEAGVLLPARHDVVDEALEHAPLARRVKRPRRVVVAVAVRDGEQVLEPAVHREGVPFEVEEHVAVRRLGERREPLVGLDGRDELVDAAAIAPSLVLHPRLFADAGQRGLADPVEPGRDRQAQRAQRRHRHQLPFDQPAPLGRG